MEALGETRERAGHHEVAQLSGGVGGGLAKLPGARVAWANFAEMTETENPGGVTIRKLDLNRVVTHRAGGVSGHARLEHGQRSKVRSLGPGLRFFLALVIAHRARARIPQIRKIVVARMIVRPGNIYTLAGGKANFQTDWFFSDVQWNRHIGLAG